MVYGTVENNSIKQHLINTFVFQCSAAIDQLPQRPRLMPIDSSLKCDLFTRTDHLDQKDNICHEQSHLGAKFKPFADPNLLKSKVI